MLRSSRRHNYYFERSGLEECSLLARLLTKGFLPGELPPPFSSSSFEEILTGGIPASWELNNKECSPDAAHLCHYNHRRVGDLRRRLSLPNPFHYFHLASTVAKHWQELNRLLEASKIAAARPISPPAENGNRAYAPKIHWKEKPKLKTQTFRGKRWLLRADISRFYPSIYTHSIPWALHTKATAKAHRGPGYAGNELDYWVRMCQEGQTLGIPIGPDTSWVIAEIISAAVQAELLKEVSNLTGFAFIDDYEFAFPERADAERGHAVLEKVLNDFELSLNPSKTRIHALPQPFQEKWRNELAGFRFEDKSMKADLLRYFDLICQLATESPRDTIFNYALGRLGRQNLAAAWDIYEPILLQIALLEPGSLKYVERELKKYRAQDLPIDVGALKETVELLIQEHAPLGHSSEVSWSLWIAILFEFQIDEAATKALGSVEDSIVALLALRARELGLFTTALDVSKWQGWMTKDALTGPQWLLAYEAGVKGWLGRGDHLNKDPRYRDLRDRGVSFYDESAESAQPDEYDLETEY